MISAFSPAPFFLSSEIIKKYLNTNTLLTHIQHILALNALLSNKLMSSGFKEVMQRNCVCMLGREPGLSQNPAAMVFRFPVYACLLGPAYPGHTWGSWLYPTIRLTEPAGLCLAAASEPV